MGLVDEIDSVNRSVRNLSDILTTDRTTVSHNCSVVCSQHGKAAPFQYIGMDVLIVMPFVLFFIFFIGIEVKSHLPEVQLREQWSANLIPVAS